LETTAPAAIILPLPTTTPDNIVTLQPIQTSCSTITSLSKPSGLFVSFISETNFPITLA